MKDITCHKNIFNLNIIEKLIALFADVLLG